MIIAFSGPKGAGKSTAMAALDPRPRPALPGYIRDNWIHIPFAGPLKGMLAALIGREAIDDRELRERPHPLLRDKTPRYAMQTLGTEWGRNLIGEDVWVDVWREQTLGVLNKGGHVVTDDLRFPNEEIAVKALGGHVVEISRPGVHRDGAHASEAYVPDYDVEIINDGTAAALQESVRLWVEGEQR